jgi:hypothetical protein
MVTRFHGIDRHKKYRMSGCRLYEGLSVSYLYTGERVLLPLVNTILDTKKELTSDRTRGIVMLALTVIVISYR